MKWKRRYILFKRIRRRSIKVFVVFFLVLFLSGWAVFKSPMVQTYLTQKVGGYLGEKTGAVVRVDEVSFQLFDTFVLKGLLVLDHREDTMLYAQDFFIGVNDYDLEKYEVQLSELGLENAYLNINTYKGETVSNFNQFIQKLNSDTTKNKQNPAWNIYVEDLNFEHLHFRNWNENLPVKEYGVDFNHLDLTEAKAEFDNLLIKENYLWVNVEWLSCKDRSGFYLMGLETNVKMSGKKLLLEKLGIETDQTDINGKLAFHYQSLKDFSDFTSKVKVSAQFDETELYGEDLAYFAPALKGLDRTIEFKGKVTGTIERLKAKGFELNYGNSTLFKGSINIDGLPDIDNAFIDAKIEQLTTTSKDIQSIPLPPFDQEKTIQGASWMKNVHNLSFQGKFTGFTSDFVAYGQVESSAGGISTDITFKKDSTGATKMIGKVKTPHLNIGQILGDENLGAISINGSLDAVQADGRSKLEFKGAIPFFDFKGYKYTNIEMDGAIQDRIFIGELFVNDPNLSLDFNGEVDFTERNPHYNFEADLKHANVAKINWLERDSSAVVSAKMVIDLKGKKLEDLNGGLSLKNVVWSESGASYSMDSLALKAIANNDREMILIESDLISGKIEGKYNLSDLYSSFLNIVAKDVPSFTGLEYSKKKSKGNNKFRLMAKMHNYDVIHTLFTPDFDFSNNARFSGQFDDQAQSYVLNFAADTVVAGGKTIHNLKLYSNNRDSSLNVVAKSDFVQLFDSIGFQKFKLTTKVQDGLVRFDLGYNNRSAFDNEAQIVGDLNMYNLDSIVLHIDESKIVYRDTVWQIHPENEILFTPNSYAFSNLNVFSATQFVGVHGKASKAIRDELFVEVKDFQLSNLKYFFDLAGITLEGDATGKVRARGLMDQAIFNSELRVERMVFNNQQFGAVDWKTEYIATEGKVGIDLSVDNMSTRNKFKTIELSGDYYPFEDGRLDMEANVTNLQLIFLEQYFGGVFSDFNRGKASAELDISGTLKHPVVEGEMRIDQFNLKVDYLNVRYAVNGQRLYFSKDAITFKDFLLTHNTYKDSKAAINGVVKHTGFKDFSYQFNAIKLDEFFCLNTTIDENSTYYGKAFVNGLLKVKGDGLSTYIGGNVSTASYEDQFRSYQTELVLPLDQTEELELNDFITFVDLSDTSKTKAFQDDEVDFGGLTLDFNFDIHPNATVRILFDPSVGDEVKAKGKGSIGMNINTDGRFTMQGGYEVQEGDYYFTLKNFLGKRFLVQPGSTITWDGDPLDATLNMHTYYRSRAKLIDLIDSTQVADYDIMAQRYGGRIPVNTNLSLVGNLWSPNIVIGISLPEGTPEEAELLESYVSGEDEINRQAFSLLLTSQFLPPHNNVGGLVNGETGINNGLQFVEGQINNALSGIWKNVDLGVDYNANGDQGDESDDALSKDELRLLAGFQYKSFSFRTDYDINNNVGDVQAEFRITEAVKAKAFHKTTEQTALDNGVNTTQGLGVFYQKSFDSFRELFRKEEEAI